MKITDEEIEYFKEADKIVKRGYYPNGQKAIDTYKKIFAEEIANGKMRDNFNPKCGGCIRQVVEITINKIKELEKKIKVQNQHHQIKSLIHIMSSKNLTKKQGEHNHTQVVEVA